MRLLVYGGSGSGKSNYAEEYLVNLPDAGQLVYIATMNPEGRDAQDRIANHRRNRRDKGFLTIERYVDLARLDVPEDCSILLECLGNLLANEMFSKEGSGKNADESIMNAIASLTDRTKNIVVVSNDLTRDGCEYPAETELYIQTLARLNIRLASEFDTVVETVCGIPLVLKRGA